MPVSSPSYFPSVAGNDNIVGINAGLKQSGNRVFLAGLNTGDSSNVNDIILIGDSVATQGLKDSGSPYYSAPGSVVIGSQSLTQVTSMYGAPAGGPVVSIGGFNAPLLPALQQSVLIGSTILQAATADAPQSGSNVYIGNNIQFFPTSFVTASDGNVVVGQNAAYGAVGAQGPFQNNVILGYQAAQQWYGTVTNNVMIGALTGQTNCSGILSNTLVGQGIVLSAAPANVVGCVVLGSTTIGGNYNTVLGSGVQPVGGNYEIVIGAGAGTGSQPTDSNYVFLVETYDGTTQRSLMYGDMNAGSLIVGKSVYGTNRDFPTGSASILKLLNGTKGSTNPIGGGYFYVSAGALHWVGSNGTDTTLGNA